MEQNRHTPGPYQLHSMVDGDPTTGDGSVCITRPDGLVIANIVPKDLDESIPNGRLMASAPELLEALVDLAEVVKDDHYKCNIYSDVDCWLDEVDKHPVMLRAEQAIAKAKGE